MPTGFPAADAIQATAGLVQTGLGLIQEGQLKKQSDALDKTRPQYQISPLAGQQLSLAESDLSNGMSAGAENAYNNLNNQQYSSAIGAIIKSGGNVNSIGSLYGDSQDGRLKLAQMKDNLRLNQINNYVRANNAYQDQEQTQWQVNKFAPWEDKAQAIANARQGASQEVSQGINSLSGGLMNGSQAIKEGNQLANPVIINPNNTNANANGTFNTNPVSDYIPSNYNFAGANQVTPMNTPIYTP